MVVNAMPRPLYFWERNPVPIVYEAGWNPELVWIGAEGLSPHWDLIPGPFSP